MVRTFKYIRRSILLGFLSVLVITPMAFARGGDGGGSHPWPWGLEVPFPWDDVQGIWKVENKGKVYYFGFRRVQDTRLFVTQFDASRCMTLGSGPGLVRNKSQKYLVAQITMKATGESYRMAIYAFDEIDSPEPAAPADGELASDPQHVMVARITSLSTVAPEIAVQMVRISDRLEFKCLGQDKKLKF